MAYSRPLEGNLCKLSVTASPPPLPCIYTQIRAASRRGKWRHFAHTPSETYVEVEFLKSVKVSMSRISQDSGNR
jgi:hypothetical protein